MAGIVKRSLTIAGHRTSISLEEPFWQLLRAAAEREQVSLAELVTRIDRERAGGNLSSAVRIHLVDRLMRSAAMRSDDPASCGDADARDQRSSEA